jgi:hypothetical protein
MSSASAATESVDRMRFAGQTSQGCFLIGQIGTWMLCASAYWVLNFGQNAVTKYRCLNWRPSL